MFFHAYVSIRHFSLKIVLYYSLIDEFTCQFCPPSNLSIQGRAWICDRCVNLINGQQ